MTMFGTADTELEIARDAFREALQYRRDYDTEYPSIAAERYVVALERELDLRTASLERCDKRWHEAQSALHRQDEDIKQVTKDRDHEHNKLVDTERDLVQARQNELEAMNILEDTELKLISLATEKDRWEWVARHYLFLNPDNGKTTIEEYHPLVIDELLTRWQERT